MPGLAQRNDQFSNASSYFSSSSSSSTCSNKSVSSNGFWSKHGNEINYIQLQKFWNELSRQARQELLRVDKQTLFEQARKNMYCSRCNGLLLEGYLQIVMYGKSLQQEGAAAQVSCSRQGVQKCLSGGGTNMSNSCQDDTQDPSVHPWGGLTTTRDGTLTLLDCYLYSKSLKGLQNVFDSARARERERELLYPDACGGGGRGWISQAMAGYGRGHGTRETCALHTARLSCDTLVDFWSALGEETQHSLLKMREEDFIERLMYRFDSKRFCRDCRRNVIREFKELKELKRMRREPQCTSWFCVADTAFQYEVSDDTVQADWCQTFADTVGMYHHFEWAIGTGEGKSDILEFENVGMNGSAQVDGLDLGGLSACYITLRAWKLDGRCTELSVKAHALKGQQCVHCRLVVGDGYVAITRGESIRRFFEHAEEAEEEEDDDSMDKDGNELDGECSRPQKHAKSPELAREFLLDAATVIFKEQVEKAFREGTARQNAHSIFVCLALKLLEERVHVACKEIITLEKQTKLLEEEEKEKREEEERKERRRMKEREKKLRRKERLKGKERDRESNGLDSNENPICDVLKEEEPSKSSDCINGSRGLVTDSTDLHQLTLESPRDQEEQFLTGEVDSEMQNHFGDSTDGDSSVFKDGNGSFMVEQSKFSRRRSKFRKEFQLDQSLKWPDRRRFPVSSESGALANKHEPRFHGENFDTLSKGVNGLVRPSRVNVKSTARNITHKFGEKFQCSNNRMSDRYDVNHCSCNPHGDYRPKVDQHAPGARLGRETRSMSNKSEPVWDMPKQFYRGSKFNHPENIRENCGRLKTKMTSGNNNSSREFLHTKKVWEPMESKKYPRSNSDSDVTLRSSDFKVDEVEPVDNCSEVTRDSGEIDNEVNSLEESTTASKEMDRGHDNGYREEVKNPCYSTEATEEVVGLFPVRRSTLSVTSDPQMSSTSNSDNCSSCLSEGDSNTPSSNSRNMESLSASDSDDASQQSERRDSPTCEQSDFHQCNGLEKKQIPSEGESLKSKLCDVSSGALESKVNGSIQSRSVDCIGNANPAGSMASHHQGMLPVMHNQNLQFPVFQAPSTMGFYHQNPVSWSAGPANGLMPFPHPNHYLFASPLGYGLNGSSHFCMQYGGLQHLPTPLFNPSQAPVFHPVANTDGMSAKDVSKVSKPCEVQAGSNGANVERVAPVKVHPTEAPPSGEAELQGRNAKVHMGSNGANGFSLFHFGGPVALSGGCKSDSMPSKEADGDFPPKVLTDQIDSDRTCNKKETTIEEYNLFAASNGIRFSIY